MPLNAELVGKQYETSTFEVTADAIEKYARATNDLNERYLSGDDVVAPSGLSRCGCLQRVHDRGDGR